METIRDSRLLELRKVIQHFPQSHDCHGKKVLYSKPAVKGKEVAAGVMFAACPGRNKQGHSQENSLCKRRARGLHCFIKRGLMHEPSRCRRPLIPDSLIKIPR